LILLFLCRLAFYISQRNETLGAIMMTIILGYVVLSIVLYIAGVGKKEQ